MPHCRCSVAQSEQGPFYGLPTRPNGRWAFAFLPDFLHSISGPIAVITNALRASGRRRSEGFFPLARQDEADPGGERQRPRRRVGTGCWNPLPLP